MTLVRTAIELSDDDRYRTSIPGHSPIRISLISKRHDLRNSAWIGNDSKGIAHVVNYHNVYHTVEVRERPGGSLERASRGQQHRGNEPQSHKTHESWFH